MRSILLFLAFGLAGTASQVMSKAGMTDVQRARGDAAPFDFLLALATNGKIVIATALYVVTYLLYLAIVARHPISEAYPLGIGLNFVLIAIAAWLFLGETMTWERGLGLGLIVAGMYVVARA